MCIYIYMYIYPYTCTNMSCLTFELFWNGCILNMLVIVGPFWVICWTKKRHFKMSYLRAGFVGSPRPTN